MNFYLVSYTATTKNHVMRNSAFEFASTCAEIARLTAEDLLGRDFTLKALKSWRRINQTQDAGTVRSILPQLEN